MKPKDGFEGKNTVFSYLTKGLCTDVAVDEDTPWFGASDSLLPPSGFMSPEERKVFEDIRSPHLKYWIPVVWFSNLASRARQEGRIQDHVDLQNILNVTGRLPVLFSKKHRPFRSDSCFHR